MVHLLTGKRLMLSIEQLGHQRGIGQDWWLKDTLRHITWIIWTFASISKMNTIIILLSLTTNYNWDLQQLNIKNTFLNGDLEEEIYMKVLGFECNLTTENVYKLKKALHKLKQSPMVQFGRFAKVMKNMGYRQSQENHTLFVKHSNLGGVTTLLVYVDNIIMTRNDGNERQTLRQCLTKEFVIKELRMLKYFLGIEIVHSK